MIAEILYNHNYVATQKILSHIMLHYYFFIIILYKYILLENDYLLLFYINIYC